MSQLALACDAEISTRHLSFIATGRATPSRDMVLRLAERLEVPLRARNSLLVSAGFAPVYPERTLSDPALTSALAAIRHLLDAHHPFPAIAVDRHWQLVASNDAARAMMIGVDPSLLTPSINSQGAQAGGRTKGTQPRRAASMVAISIFFIGIMASKARLA